MKTLRDKIDYVVSVYGGGCSCGIPNPCDCDEFTQGAVNAIMTIIANHNEWSDPKSCRFGHVFSDCGKYEITSANEVYYIDDLIGLRHTLDDAKQLAKKHKGGLG